MVDGSSEVLEWVLLSYRLPREPSTPRIALWRRLKRLGVAQIADGLVALPADARTREHLEWAAEQVVDDGGDASVWVARPTTSTQQRALAQTMATARATEYDAIAQEATDALDAEVDVRRRTAQRLRRTLREVTRRDYFPPRQRALAAAALRDLEAASDAGRIEVGR